MAKVKDTGYRMIIENHGGRWMFVNDDIYSFMECSGCKEQVLIKDVEKYCPNCGAKLEGVGDQCERKQRAAKKWRTETSYL